MKDGIIKGTGTSRKIYANLPATYEEFRMMAAQSNIFMDVLFNADGWQQQPDFLNRRNLLQGSTAALLGLPDTAVPDDALRSIGRLSGSVGNEYVWSKSGTVQIPVEGESTTLDVGPNTTFYHSKMVEYDNNLKKYVLVNPEKISTYFSPEPSIINDLLLSFNAEYVTSPNFVFTQDVCVFHVSGYPNSQCVTKCLFAKVIQGEKTESFGYVNSPNKNAYPPDEPDGFEYEYLFRIGELSKKASIVTGRYTGNGETEKTLTFNKLPSFLVVTTASPNLVASSGSWIFWIPGVTRSNTANSSNPFAYTNIEVSGNSIKLIGQASGLEVDDIAALAFNYKDRTYHYFYVV